MYHTFQAASVAGDGSEGDGGGKVGKSAASRRISTSNACVECRRRKIRCDGAQPCGQCQWYHHPDLCAYSKPVQRVVPSRKLVERLQTQVDQSHAIVSRLFPGQDLEALLSLPREELVNLAVTMPIPDTSPSYGSEPTPSVTRDTAPLKSEGAESLDALEQAPEQTSEVDEARRHRDKVQSISDDVNGLSLSVDRQSSYVGVSSITAALKVIFKTAPITRPFIAQSYNETALPSRSNSPPPQLRDPDPLYLPPADIGHKLIDSYFKHVHCMMPMIDEDQFWHTYLYGERKDSPWLSLLNIVMALGSMAMSTCDNEDHIVYFKRSRKHLDLETFGSGNLLVLQALGLMSGYYLHWLNRPNEANSLMGATLRMATALGLHREYGPVQASAAAATTSARSHVEVPAEIRRRTWWSLFILDTWANLTTGRPSLGRVGPGITVQSPRIPEQMNNAQYLASLRLLPIIHNIEFCKIATKVQDAFAARPLLKFEQLFTLDAELVSWHDELPPLLRDIIDKPPPKRRAGSRGKRVTPSTASRKNPFDFSQPPDRDHTACPEVLKTPRAVMHWRYQNLRMLMHRPFLLAAALRKSSYSGVNAEENVAVERCRLIAGQTISDIVATCQEELIAGWNAVWLMYQAVMVPLVSLFAHISIPAGETETSPAKSPESAKEGDDDIMKWQYQVETAIAFFDKMHCFSVAAKKSKEVVERLYQASQHIRAYNEQHSQQQQYTYTPEQPRRIDSGTTDGILSLDLGQFSPTGMTSFNPQEVGQNSMLGWGLSPNGDAAMNVFWDDMMWETIPELPEQPGWLPGFDQVDCLAPNGVGHAGANGQEWPPWMHGDQQR